MSTVRPPVFVGISGPIAARRMPRTRLTISVAAERSAPVEPALTNASPCPSASIRRPTTMDDSFRVLTTDAGSSCISTTSSACAISTPCGSVSIPCRLRHARICSPRPTSTTCTPSFSAASSAPSAAASGERSPPIASTTIRIKVLPFVYRSICASTSSARWAIARFLFALPLTR